MSIEKRRSVPKRAKGAAAPAPRDFDLNIEKVLDGLLPKWEDDPLPNRQTKYATLCATCSR